jgi:hypothetical protein
MLIRGLDLEDDASGATLGLYIKPQTRPCWGPSRTVHEATRWHAAPLSGGWICCPTRAWASGYEVVN